MDGMQRLRVAILKYAALGGGLGKNLAGSLSPTKTQANLGGTGIGGVGPAPSVKMGPGMAISPSIANPMGKRGP